MLFYQLAAYLEKLERTSSRNEITKILAEVLALSGADETDKICYLLLGEILPAYQGVEFNIAEKLMIIVLAQAFGRTRDDVEKRYRIKGDLGDAVMEFAAPDKKMAIRPDVAWVYARLLEIAKYSGEGSQKRKIGAMAGLISKLDNRSAKFVTRIPLGKLRLGFSEATILDALSLMEKGDKSARSMIERAYNVTADIGAIAKKIRRFGLAGLKNFRPRPGVPIRASLAERISSVEEAIFKVGPDLGVEFKLDGFRTQIHAWSDRGRKQIRIFSRNLENTTKMFPEIVASARKLPAKSFILDGEAIGYNPKTDRFVSFQETAQRKRKYDVEEFARKIPISVFAFDILYLDGISLLELPFHERRKILARTLGRRTSRAIRLVAHHVTADPDDIVRTFKKSIEAGLEGLVLKNIDQPYQAGSRGFHWVKLKSTTAALQKLRGVKGAASRLPDTVDCVVMGAYRGRGKRALFGIGGFLLGLVGPGGKYYTITRLGSGLSDDQFKKAGGSIKKLKVIEPPKEYVVAKEMRPDIWVRPSLVAEILADEITLSSRHTAGKKADGPGHSRAQRAYSLRFPRLVRFRYDKNPQDATTIAEIEKMYRMQTGVRS